MSTKLINKLISHKKHETVYIRNTQHVKYILYTIKMFKQYRLQHKNCKWATNPVTHAKPEARRQRTCLESLSKEKERKL